LESEPPDAPPSQPGGETLLVVEDEEQVRAVVLRVLRRAGYRVARTPTPACKRALDNGR
jgi:CheY-like chemotaxis protein